jgi:hypothetical protein
MFRRPIRRPLRRVQAGSIPPALQHSNQLMASGQYDEAAGIFEQFANGALARNGPRAAWFLLQAGQARLQAGQVQQGMAHLQRGLGLLAGSGQFQRLYHAGNRFIAEFKARGLVAEAQQIEILLQTSLPAGFTPGAGDSMERSRPLLPTNCPSCGGSLRPDEVEWADGMTAECPYCGSAVRAEK